MHLEITNNDIAIAEKILFGKRGVFDLERKDFIKNQSTIDLQAIPGSGKTTALLAKLLILEKHLPFSDGSGILVVSHTNTAVNEIKRKIGNYCPNLFKYPNFIGTIQSFVDQFLAIPYYSILFKKNILRIDNETYENYLLSYYYKIPYGQRAWVERKRDKEIFLKSLRFDLDLKLVHIRNDEFLTLGLGENSNTYRMLKCIKLNVFKLGYLSYDDAYLFANLYIKNFPKIINILQNRFRCVFVDEMQDMDNFQVELLDGLFKNKKKLNHSFQRIGDKNQSIFNGYNLLKDVWKNQNKVLKFTKSHRLSPQIAHVVKYFGIDYIDIKGVNTDKNIYPHLFLYSPNVIQKVIPEFGKLIKQYIWEGKIDNSKRNTYKAIGWTAKKSDGKICLTDYFPTYNKKEKLRQINHDNLHCYLNLFDKDAFIVNNIRTNILNALLKLIRFEKEENYTINQFINHLKENFPDTYYELKQNIYDWAIKVLKQDIESVRVNCCNYFEILLRKVFQINSLNDKSTYFLTDTSLPILGDNFEILTRPNIYNDDEVEIEICTVHSVKGETHTATLYLETHYYEYESTKSILQLLGNRINNNTAKRKKESAKMMYVGFSRPTTILCFAVDANRINLQDISALYNNNWNIRQILE